jgi:hypothetical protein
VIDTDLLAIAEAPAAYLRPPHPRTVFGDGYTLSQMGPHEGVVQAIRLDPGRLAEARADAHAVARERDWESLTWWTSELTRPRGLGPTLRLEPGDRLTALVLTAPPAGVTDFAVRPVETLDDFASAQDIDAAANGWPLSTREAHAASWERVRDHFKLWLALDGDRPVGMARAAAANGALMLIGGATLPAEQGRGVYRALVEARWYAAVERRTPALVVAANSQSGPILERLGFRSVGAIQAWRDRL